MKKQYVHPYSPAMNENSAECPAIVKATLYTSIYVEEKVLYYLPPQKQVTFEPFFNLCICVFFFFPSNCFDPYYVFLLSLLGLYFL
jgi:hypothetical protein